MIRIPKGYTQSERQAIGSEMLDKIRELVAKGISPETGETFKNNKYSAAYAKTFAFRRRGKDINDVNLKLSGDMLAAMEVLDSSKDGQVKIGFDESSDEAGKAEGNQIGTYGSDRASSSKARPFIKLNEKFVKQILKDYKAGSQTSQERATLKNIADNSLINTQTKVEGLSNLFDFTLNEPEE